MSTAPCRAACAFLGVCGLIAAGRSAVAQQLIERYFPSNIPGYSADTGQSVVQRAMLRDLRDTPGILMGDILVRPRFSESIAENSSVLGVPGSGSAEIESQGGLALGTNWGRNGIGAAASFDDRRYPSVPIADQTNWTASLGGSVTAGLGDISLGYSHIAQHLSANDLGALGVVTPIPVTVDDAHLSQSFLFGRFTLTPSLDLRRYGFGQSAGSPAIDFSSLSHDVESGSVTSRYALATGTAVIVILRGAVAQFAAVPADDYTDVGGFVGLDFQGGDLLQLRALVGAESRAFDQGAGPAVTIPTLQIDLSWFPTRRDTVSAFLTRGFSDPVSLFTSNQIVTLCRVELDHEVRRSIMVKAYLGLGRSEAQAAAPATGSVADNQFQFGASASWTINRVLSASLSYGHVGSFGSTGAEVATAALKSLSNDTIALGLTWAE